MSPQRPYFFIKFGNVANSKETGIINNSFSRNMKALKKHLSTFPASYLG